MWLQGWQRRAIYHDIDKRRKKKNRNKRSFYVYEIDYDRQPKGYTREEIKEMDKKFFSVLGIIVVVFLILVGIGFLAQYGLI